MSTTPHGIAVITRNRPEVCLETVEAIRRYTDEDYRLVVGVDRDPATAHALGLRGVEVVTTPGAGGIAANRNVTVHALRDCPYIFLFEDDFRPCRGGWLTREVELLADGTVPFLLHLWDSIMATPENPAGAPRGHRVTAGGRVDLYTMSTTFLQSFRRETLEKVGYWNPAFGTRYGFEDADWGLRALQAYGWPEGLWPSHPETLAWFDQVPNHAMPSSDGKTEAQRQADIPENLSVWARLRAEGVSHVPYPYAEDAP